MEKEKRKIINIFAFASFLNDLGSDIIYPLWPLFIKSLKANMVALGLIDGIGDAVVSLSSFFSGYLADRIKKRKIFVWLGYLFGSLSRLGYALAKSWFILIPLKILDRFGKIRQAPRDAIIADVSDDKDRGRNFGFLRAMDNLGAVCGIIIALLFFKFLGFRKLFFLAALPSLIGVFLIIIFIKEKKIEKNIKKDIKTFNFSFKFFDKDYYLYLFSSLLFSLSYFSYSFLLIYANNLGYQEAFIPLFYLIFTLTASLFSLPFGKLADKTSRKFTLFLGYLFWLIAILGFIYIKTKFLLFFLFLIYGLNKSALEPSQKALVSELSPIELRATGIGFFQMVNGIIALFSSFIAGILWERFSMKTPFYFSFLLTILATIILLFVKERRHLI
ncbi:MAG: MFS transporter [candidate division WOR-3 bacterium]|nr:MFS transporter [candidate division WOR-3 bacterium]MCX7837627.1 MFS transporter [candidate division WOR-3 bacterium]MDW8114434.1 MFS transporter [candidate division WOR-3 bacterium]